MLADLEQAERRLDRVTRAARGGERAAIAEQAWLRAARRGARRGPPGAQRARRPRTPRTRCPRARPLTAKPVLFVANVDEGADEVPPEIAAHAAAQGAGAVAVSARLEAELGELADEEAAAMRAELGIGEAGLRARCRAAPSRCST